jgi:pimeloyl-ACP methyl ester carboxylesterase
MMSGKIPAEDTTHALCPLDGARIYYEETGRGTPILFIHEFGGDHRSWEDQMRHFGRGWRGITWGARGYPPSDCPATRSCTARTSSTAMPSPCSMPPRSIRRTSSA